MQREVIKWLQTLDLSTPVKNPRRDLANGAAAAEIISRYADKSTLSMHGITTGVSLASRRDNWAQVQRALAKLHCTTVTADLIDAVMRLQANAAQAVLENLYEFFTGRRLAMRTVDAVGVITGAAAAGDHFLRPGETAPLAAVLEATGEVPPGAIMTPHGSDSGGAGGSEDDADEDEGERREAQRRAALRAQRCLALTTNEELAGGVGPALHQPGYARATAAALVHAASGTRHGVALRGAKFAADERTAHERNERLLRQHDVLTERVRADQVRQQQRAAAAGAAPGKRREGAGGKERASILTTLRGPYAPTTADYRRRMGAHSSSATTRKNGSRSPQQQQRGHKGRAGGDTPTATPTNTNTANSNNNNSGVKVRVNVMSDALRDALVNSGAHLQADCSDAKSVELFTSFRLELRLAIGSLLRDILVAEGEYPRLLSACRAAGGGDGSDGGEDDSQLEDLLSLVMAHREALSMRCLRACWASLHQNLAGIVAAIHVRPQEYAYLVHACSFAFALESAQLPLLHVTSFDDDDSANINNINGGRDEEEDAVSATAGKGSRRHQPQQQQQRHFRSQSIGNVLIDSGRRRSTLRLSVSGTQPRHQQTVIRDRRAFDIACVFIFLSAVGAELAAAHPDDALEVLQLFFCPAARRALLPFGSAALVEAVARVVVQTIVPRNTSKGKSGAGGEDDDNDDDDGGGRGPARTDRDQWQLEERVDMFLTEVLQPLVLGGYPISSSLAAAAAAASTASSPTASWTAPQRRSGYSSSRALEVPRLPNVTQLEFRYHLLLYHTLGKISTAGGRWCLPTSSSTTKRRRRSCERGSDSGRGSPFARGSHAGDDMPVYPLVQRCGEAAAVCLGSESAEARGLGCALVVRLLTWEAWDSVAGVAGALVAPAALGSGGRDWEPRVLLLEALTMLLQKLAFLIAEERAAAPVSGDEEDEEEKEEEEGASNVPLGRLAAGERRRVLARIPLPPVEAAAVACLESFCTAPHTHRLLALSIVGRRLQPDFQPRLSAAWIAMLAALPPAVLAQSLSPDDEAASDFSSAQQQQQQAKPQHRSSTHKAPAGSHGERWMATTLRDAPRRAGDGDAASPIAAAASDSGDASIRMLRGKIEPAYVVAPLNQTWETFGVLQTALQRRGSLTRGQLVSLLVAAFMSPQPIDVLEAQVLHHAYAALAEGDAHGSRSRNKDAEEDEEEALQVTMRELILTQQQQQQQQPSSPSSPGVWGDLLEAGLEDPSLLVERFWKAVLGRLLPDIRSLVLDDDEGVAAAAAAGTRGEEEAEEEETRAEQRRTAVALLVAVLQRYTSVPVDTLTVGDLLDEIAVWTEGEDALL